MITGVALAIWCNVLGVNWSGAVRITQGQRLVTTDPRRSCNPIYSGMVPAMIWNGAVAAGTLGALLGFILALGISVAQGPNGGALPAGGVR